MGTLFEWSQGNGIYVGALPGRKMPWLAIQDGSVIEAVACFRSPEDAQAFQDAMYKLLGMKTRADG